MLITANTGGGDKSDVADRKRPRALVAGVRVSTVGQHTVRAAALEERSGDRRRIHRVERGS
ncbi:hypothetical protein ACFQGT_16515 [Natrialbaceae archaeon GCM10025810]|uniref:hypothetical protein n=1 Tax=Halovalidus salilacus TaxID=3075124 RepID=UPI00361E825E